MNGSDLCSQVWSYYSTQSHKHRRNWWPLLWALLDASMSNTVKICQLLGDKRSHSQIQEFIALRMLRNPASSLRSFFRPSLPIPEAARPTDAPKGASEHTKIHIWAMNEVRKERRCVECASIRPSTYRTARRVPLQERSSNTPRIQPPRTRMACKECQVALCDNGRCWQRYHDEQWPHREL